MSNTSRFLLLRGIALGCGLTLVLAACGSSDDSSGGDLNGNGNEVASSAEPAASEELTEAAESAPDPEAETEVSPPEPTASVVRVTGGLTDPWEIEGNCSWTPDNTGAASSLWVVEDTDDSKEEQITMLEVWPISLDDDSETSLIGSIVEPDGNLLTVIAVETSYDGSTITVLADVHDGMKTLEDPADLTLKVTCGP